MQGMEGEERTEGREGGREVERRRRRNVPLTHHMPYGRCGASSTPGSFI